MIDVETEKTIVRNALLRLFNPTMTHALVEGFYAHNPAEPQFVEVLGSPSPVQSEQAVPSKLEEPNSPVRFDEPAETPSFRIEVDDFATTHFAKDPFPKFRLRLAALSSTAMLKPGMPDMAVKLSIHNKWADITGEVLPPHTELVRTMHNGVLDVADLMFTDVSLKHGGYFTVHVESVDFNDSVMCWRSSRFVIQSVKTHCNKKRKTREETATPAMFSPIPQPAPREAISFNGVNSALRPNPIKMSLNNNDLLFSMPSFDGFRDQMMMSSSLDIPDLFAIN